MRISQNDTITIRGPYLPDIDRHMGRIRVHDVNQLRNWLEDAKVLRFTRDHFILHSAKHGRVLEGSRADLLAELS